MGTLPPVVEQNLDVTTSSSFNLTNPAEDSSKVQTTSDSKPTTITVEPINTSLAPTTVSFEPLTVVTEPRTERLETEPEITSVQVTTSKAKTVLSEPPDPTSTILKP